MGKKLFRKPAVEEPDETAVEEELEPNGDNPSKDISDELAQIREERDEFQDLLQRKQAEFENYRKRVIREKSELRKSVEAEVIGELLHVIDTCEAGLQSMQANESSSVDSSYQEGYSLLLKQLHKILEKYGVEEVPGSGSEFDPAVHEAVVRDVTKEYPENEVVEQFRKGYIAGDRLLRPAQVRVSVWPED